MQVIKLTPATEADAAFEIDSSALQSGSPNGASLLCHQCGQPIVEGYVNADNITWGGVTLRCECGAGNHFDTTEL